MSGRRTDVIHTHNDKLINSLNNSNHAATEQTRLRFHSVITSVKMANRKVLLGLLFVYLLVNITECGRFGGSRGGFGGSRGGFGRSSSSGRHSSSSSGFGSFSKPSYPSSSSGLSGFGSYSKPSYPSSSSGLSGFGSISKPSYPSSSSGLSGFGSISKPSYPSSSSGMSGFGSHSNPSYPSSSSGFSGFGSNSKPSYPSSSSGMSGYGSSSSGSHYSTSYGSSSGSSGYKPNYSSNSYNTNNGYNSHNTGYGTHVVHHTIPTYYTSPQYVYVNEYRHSNSRYGDLLTGLALYNMGRSNSHYHDHYYYDDYYRRRYNSPSGEYKSNSKPEDEAICTLKITENSKVETLKIPCEIVSTFTEQSSKVNNTVSQLNTTVCTTKTVMINNTVPANGTSLNTLALDKVALNNLTNSNDNITVNESTITSTLSPNVTISASKDDLRVFPQNTSSKEGLLLNSTLPVNNITMVNITVCNSTVTNATDPLTLKGPAVDASNMQCSVEIRTKNTYFSNKVSCDTLIKYSKMPEPARDTGILPAKNKLKTWLSNPPWWLSMFIAV